MAIIVDGFPCQIVFYLDETAPIKPKSITPPSLSAGGPIATTTMQNHTVRTQLPKTLYSVGQSKVMGSYDPACYNNLKAMMGKNQLISVVFSDGSHFDFYGWIDNAVFSAMTEGGEQPTVDLTIETSNTDGGGNESAPTYHAGTGTTTSTALTSQTTTTAAPAP